jgi:hypothetical protein
MPASCGPAQQTPQRIGPHKRRAAEYHDPDTYFRPKSCQLPYGAGPARSADLTPRPRSTDSRTAPSSFDEPIARLISEGFTSAPRISLAERTSCEEPVSAD